MRLLGLEERHTHEEVIKLKKSEHFSKSYGFLQLKTQCMKFVLFFYPSKCVRLTGTELLLPTVLSWPFLNVGKIFKNIFESVASIFVKCVVMVYCGDSVSVGLSFYLFFSFVCK